jgi:hypothetical protein
MPQPSLPTWPVRDLAAPANVRVGIRPGVPPVVEICGEIDIQSASQLRDELLRVVSRHGPQLALDLVPWPLTGFWQARSSWAARRPKGR